MTDRLSDSQLSLLSDYVSASMGLYFPASRWRDLERQTQLAAKELGYPTLDSFLTWLLSAPRDQAQIEILSSYLTIAETYFWREPQAIEALRDQILPPLIQARQSGSRQLRIWCAGCATGEEPYSIAIVLRSLIPDLDAWQITLLATDINPKILSRARAGIYREWSFRNVPPGFRESYFRPMDSGQYELLPKIRRMVTFAYLNLAEDVFPSPVNNTMAMDIIFCRNVLMYFTEERAKQVGVRLYASLLENGWFFTSSSELSNTIFAKFDSVHFPGAIVFRRTAKNRLLLAKPPKDLPLLEAVPSPRTEPLKIVRIVPEGRVAEGKIDPAPAVFSSVALSAASSAVSSAVSSAASPDVQAAIRSLANQGRLDEAWTACVRAIDEDRLNLGLHFLAATILQEQGRDAEAMTYLRQVLFLDSRFVLGYFSLGNLAHRMGNPTTAKQSLENALTLLDAYAPDDLVPEAEGLTAGRLGKIIRTTLKTREGEL